jgi:hypothetical protein
VIGQRSSDDCQDGPPLQRCSQERHCIITIGEPGVQALGARETGGMDASRFPRLDSVSLTATLRSSAQPPLSPGG